MKMQCKKARRNISLALDIRLQAAAIKGLQAHLDICPSCREWQGVQGRLLELMKAPPAPPQPSAYFYALLRQRIHAFPAGARSFTFYPGSLRPALRHAAMLLILGFSALLGFFLGNRLEAPAADTAVSVFSRTMHLDAFADLPAESFGAVYERLLQGER